MTGRHWLMISSSCRYLFSKHASIDFHIAPPSPCLDFRLSSLAGHLSYAIRSGQPKRHQRLYGSSLTLFLTLDLRQLLSACIVSVPATLSWATSTTYFNCFEKSSLVSSSSQLSSHKCVVPPSCPGGTSLSSGAQSAAYQSAYCPVVSSRTSE